ncbi:hypothetical protein ACIPIU_10210 [Streptomyces massasporeus]|uniref:hypothetical protein n=1 Tax=Streptomyces massasporeus TaxID=67324 RepID=UPI0036ED4ED5
MAQTGETASGFSATWTWGSMIALMALVISTWLIINHRRRDGIAKWLQPGYEAASESLVVLNRLALKPAIEGVTADLHELIDLVSRLRLAEQRSPELPFGVIVAELEGYQKNVLPHDYEARLAANTGLLSSYLTLTRMQGIKLEAARTAIASVQRLIEKRTRK